MSRPAVREAVRALEILGLVHCVQGDGNYLADDLSNCLIEPLSLMFSLSDGNVEQVQHLRHALEVQTAVLAATNCSETDAVKLRALIDQLNQSTDELTRADLDRELHYLIADIADNPMIMSVLKAVSHLIESIITGIRVSIMNDFKKISVIDEQHRAIVDAIIGKDPLLASKTMNEHMRLIESYVSGAKDNLNNGLKEK